MGETRKIFCTVLATLRARRPAGEWALSLPPHAEDAAAAEEGEGSPRRGGKVYCSESRRMRMRGKSPGTRGFWAVGSLGSGLESLRGLSGC